MGDREIKQFNRVIFAKWGNRTQELHLQRLKNEIKPVIDNTPPPTFAHLADRKKVKQRWADEQSRIEYENLLLLTRMRSIMTETQNKQFLDAGHAGSTQGGSQSILLGGDASKGSLNRGERIREMKRILQENEALLSRIQSRGPTYSVAEWERDHMLKEKQLSGMGRFAYTSSTLPASVMAEMSRPKVLKRYGTLRHPVPKDTPTSPNRKQYASTSSLGSTHYIDDSAQSTPAKGGPLSTSNSGTPRRVHHLPPRVGANDEKQGHARMASGSKKKRVDVRPIEISIQLEHLTGHLNADRNEAPRVFVYLRQETGEYDAYREVVLETMSVPRRGIPDDATAEDEPNVELPMSTIWRGLALIPGMPPAPATSSTPSFDRRVRLAIFSSSDPSLSSGAAFPLDTSHLLGEARFSLQHFLTFTRPLYKLKVLRHGLPISGPKFGEVDTTNMNLSEDEIERRRCMPEPILILQYMNKDDHTNVASETPSKMSKNRSKPTSPSSTIAPFTPAPTYQPESKEDESEAQAAAAAAEQQRMEEEAAATAAEQKRQDDAEAAALAAAALARAQEEVDRQKRQKAEREAAEAAAEAARQAEADAAAAAAEEERVARAASADKRARIASAARKAREASAKRKEVSEPVAEEPTPVPIDPRVAELMARLIVLFVEPTPPTESLQQLAHDLMTSGADDGEIDEFITACQAQDVKYELVSEVLNSITNGRIDRNTARTQIHEAISYSELLPSDLHLTDGDIDQLARECGRPLLLVTPVHESTLQVRTNDLVAACQSLDEKAFKFKQVLHLSVALKRHLQMKDMSEEDQAATKIQAIARGRSTRQAAAAAAASNKKQADGDGDDAPPSKSAADVLADIQSSKAAQEAEVARVMAERGLTAEPEEEEEEWSKPYVEEEVQPTHTQADEPEPIDEEEDQPPTDVQPPPVDSPVEDEFPPVDEFPPDDEFPADFVEEDAPMTTASEPVAESTPVDAARSTLSEDEAATRIQSIQRGRAVRAAKDSITAERQSLKEAAAEQREIEAKKKAAADEERQAKERADAAEAEAKLKADEESKKKADDLKKKAESAKAAADAAKKAADDADVELMQRIKQQADLLANKVFQVTLHMGGKSIPSASSVSALPSPMIALYVKDPSTGAFTFVSQTERIQESTHPTFIEPITIEQVGNRSDKQLMFSVYNVSNEESIKEEDVTGTAMVSEKELFEQIIRIKAGGKLQTMELPIARDGAIIPEAYVTIVNLTFDEGCDAPPLVPPTPTSTTFAPPEGEVAIWVTIKHLILPDGVKECNSLAALYTKDHQSSNFNYIAQTDVVSGFSNKINFQTPLCISRPNDASDTDCMLNVYNHLADDGEVSDSSALGACLFSLSKLLSASKGAASVSLVRGGQVVGQVVLKTRRDASSTNVTRPSTAMNMQTANALANANMTAAPPAATKLEKAITGYDLTISCANLPPNANPMVALYMQDATTSNFGYLGQTEKSTGSNPLFDSKIHLSSHDLTSSNDCALMLMIYDVIDESNIQETDQVGTCALTWKYLREQLNTEDSSITLPLLTASGEQHDEATITIQIKQV